MNVVKIITEIQYPINLKAHTYDLKLADDITESLQNTEELFFVLICFSFLESGSHILLCPPGQSVVA